MTEQPPARPPTGGVEDRIRAAAAFNDDTDPDDLTAFTAQVLDRLGLTDHRANPKDGS